MIKVNKENPFGKESASGISISLRSLEIGGKELIHDSEMILNPRVKYGFIGRNGSGKSTILNLIYKTSKDEPLEENVYLDGRITIPSNIKIAYLPQEPKFQFSGTVEDYLNYVSGNFGIIFKRYQELSSREELTSEEMEEYNSLLEEMNLFDLWDYGERRRRILNKLGIEGILERNINGISGGEATRVALAGVLLSDANFWLLDEPTNNLDSEGIELLIEEIRRFRGGVLIVTHDRRILNRVKYIYEIDEETKTIRSWGGNYDFYKTKKREEFEARVRAYEAQEEKKKKLLKSIEELKTQAQEFEKRSRDAFYRAKGAKLAARAEAQMKRIERELEELTMPKPPERPHFPKPNIEPPKGTILRIRNVSYEIDGRRLFYIGDLSLDAGERLLIKGPNGSGKTTLLRIIIGDLKPTEGSVSLNGRTIGYLPQSPTIENSELSVAQYLSRVYELSDDTIKKILSLMKVLEVYNLRLKDLSLGEIRRIQIAAILSKNPDVLILDEPTNHLDVYTIEELVEILKDYKGTIIFVSHDEYFINDIKPNKILTLDKN